MSVERYVAARVEHFRLQITRGDYSLMPGLKAEANALWKKMASAERSEAAEKYFVDVLACSASLPR